MFFILAFFPTIVDRISLLTIPNRQKHLSYCLLLTSGTPPKMQAGRLRTLISLRSAVLRARVGVFSRFGLAERHRAAVEHLVADFHAVFKPHARPIGIKNMEYAVKKIVIFIGKVVN